ncbi:hypothetical protein RIR_jg658.t1 [Rhizophagus irregularis DAOM 181602=DAOM 197198]|nr:hypothetical protein RIR_jg658.t1 [Rhizophagus irregularis DAOM 181602=DAOM 197198]
MQTLQCDLNQVYDRLIKRKRSESERKNGALGSQRARATITANVTTTTTATATTTNIATITATTATTTATATIAATAIATIITTAPATTALTTAHTAPFDPLDNSMYQNNNLSEEISKLFSPLKTMKREQKEY